MKYPYDLRLNRRQWLLAITAALSGCGGGGGSNLAAAPGTGGTGIGMQGPITGFGSVIVNNTKFDDSAASVYLDGVKQATSVDLRVGMVANISGSLDAGGTSGSATRIDVWSVASGDVSQVDFLGSSFSMVGMEFSTDVATSFEGLQSLVDISIGTPLTVWGVQTSPNARSWRATRVKLLSSAPAMFVSTGLFDASAQMLNGMQLSGSYLTGLVDQLLRVEGVFDIGTNTLDVRSKPIAITAEQQVASSGLFELEGVVTAFTRVMNFSIGTTRVDASKATVTTAGQTVSLNSSVEATGSMQNGVLIASKVEIKSGDSRAQIDITGVVDHFSGVSSFEVRGQKCDASTATVIHLGPSNLQMGTKVRVLGTSQGQEILVVQTLYLY
jgi:hypothetical protein